MIPRLRRVIDAPRPLTAVVAALLAFVLLLGVVAAGLRLRGSSAIGDLPPAAGVDYSTGLLSGIAPLTAEFIANVLGGVIAPRGEGARTIPAGHRPGDERKPARRVEIVTALTNDDRAKAHRIQGVPFTARTDTRRATREPDERRPCGDVTGGSVWFRYEPLRDIGLIATTFGSNYSTALTVYAGPEPNIEVGCDTDVAGQSIVQFVAEEGTTYWFQVVGPAGGGDLVFNLDPHGVTTLASASADGSPADASSSRPTVSGDGRLVAFDSSAENLVATRTAPGPDVFLRDRRTHTMTLVSVSSTGRPGNGVSAYPFISGDGRSVAFVSDASNLVAGDTNGLPDVFVRDLVARRTERVSVSSSGAQQMPTPSTDEADLGYQFPTLSYDGRYVAFQSSAPNLVPNDRNRSIDVFVHDRVTRRTERVSVDSSGRERGPEEDPLASSAPLNPTDDPDPAGPRPIDASMTPSISGDGRVVIFRTSAGNLVPDDDNRASDVFVHDRVSRTTERITSAPLPASTDDDDQPFYPVNELNQRQALSYDGNRIVFSASWRPGIGPNEGHVFLYDRTTQRLTQVDLSSAGEGADHPVGSRGPSISSDGRYVAFHSSADNLVPGGDENGVVDVFLRDLETRTTVRLTDAPTPGRACPDCGNVNPSISADGLTVTYMSQFVNAALVPDPDNEQQVFVHDRTA